MADVVDNVTGTNYGSSGNSVGKHESHDKYTAPTAAPWKDYTYGGYTGETSNTGSQYINDYINNCINSVKDCIYHIGDANSYRNKCIAAWEKKALGCYNNMICPLVTDAQANADCASATEQSMINDAIAARRAGINAGIGKARSGLLGDASSATNAISTGNNAYGSSIQNQGSTQADYLMKMGQACALCNCANNMQRGGLLNAISAGFIGAGQGASLGATIGGGSK